MFRPAVFLSALCVLLAAGCVQYRTQTVRVETSAAAPQDAPDNPFKYRNFFINHFAHIKEIPMIVNATVLIEL